MTTKKMATATNQELVTYRKRLERSMAEAFSDEQIAALEREYRRVQAAIACDYGPVSAVVAMLDATT